MTDLIWQIPLGVMLLSLARAFWKITNGDEDS
jgi:hypothetical protein